MIQRTKIRWTWGHAIRFTGNEVLLSGRSLLKMSRRLGSFFDALSAFYCDADAFWLSFLQQMRAVTILFDLTLFSPPSSAPAHTGEEGDDLALCPAFVGLGATVPPSDLASTQLFNLNTSSASISHAWNDQPMVAVEEHSSVTHFPVSSAPHLTSEEFERFGGSVEGLVRQ